MASSRIQGDPYGPHDGGYIRRPNPRQNAHDSRRPIIESRELVTKIRMNLPWRLSDLGQGAKIMMRLHQGTEPGLLFRNDNIDNHFGQIHPSASDHPQSMRTPS